MKYDENKDAIIFYVQYCMLLSESYDQVFGSTRAKQDTMMDQLNDVSRVVNPQAIESITWRRDLQKFGTQINHDAGSLTRGVDK